MTDIDKERRISEALLDDWSPSRRDFLEVLALGGAAGLCVLLFKGLSLRSKVENKEKLEWFIDQQAPQIRELLLETLQSDRLDNLGLFTDPVQNDIIQMTQDSQERLFSKDIELRDRTRWEVASYVFSLYYHGLYPDPTLNTGYDEYKETGTGQRYFDFLDETVGKIDPGTIRSQSGARQANMWVEAYFRAFAFSLGFDASQRDGVYTSKGFLNTIFVPLQHHSPFPGGQP